MDACRPRSRPAGRGDRVGTGESGRLARVEGEAGPRFAGGDHDRGPRTRESPKGSGERLGRGARRPRGRAERPAAGRELRVTLGRDASPRRGARPAWGSVRALGCGPGWHEMAEVGVQGKVREEGSVPRGSSRRRTPGSNGLESSSATYGMLSSYCFILRECWLCACACACAVGTRTCVDFRQIVYIPRKAGTLLHSGSN